MLDFVVIDFETATHISSSACSVGLCVVKNLQIVESYYHLIQPPGNHFNDRNIGIHGIYPADVENEPLFVDVWDKISRFFNGNHLIMAHNAQFDMSVLHSCLAYYGIAAPNFSYIDTMSICGKKRLDVLSKEHGIEFLSHHNAIADAECCAKIVISTINRQIKEFILSKCKDFYNLNPIEAINNGNVRNSKFNPNNNINYSLIVSNQNYPKHHVLRGKNVVITGDFASYTRRELVDTLASIGVIPQSAITRKTDFLLIGKQSTLVKGSISKKERDATKLIEKGYNILFIYEPDLVRMLEELGCYNPANRIEK